ncbi:tetratricopeptide repeat protein [uncultured Shimia sp.]|uniref:tetratricopeptide repeat protein n=1 Tax=uncultured Shimia sp. TaxID=573152 RepID=UPI0025D69F47|nr:tetratricopeptide repeat protein [uncultured Shimia sp.]
MKHLVAAFLVSGTSLAAECPKAPDHSAAVDKLIARVQEADNQRTAQEISNDMWQFWTDAPDEVAQEILDRGMQKRSAWDLLGAREDFDRLVRYCPDYAEGYNQRAFVNFLQQDFEAALPDLERAIALSPRHVAALSGRALTLIGLGRGAEAQDTLAAALELNPWLPERSLYTPAPVKEAPGEKL